MEVFLSEKRVVCIQSQKVLLHKKPQNFLHSLHYYYTNSKYDFKVLFLAFIKTNTELSTEVQGVIHRSTGFRPVLQKKLYHGTAGDYL